MDGQADHPGARHLEPAGAEYFSDDSLGHAVVWRQNPGLINKLAELYTASTRPSAVKASDRKASFIEKIPSDQFFLEEPVRYRPNQKSALRCLNLSNCEVTVSA
jgi:hypothetical protein